MRWKPSAGPRTGSVEASDVRWKEAGLDGEDTGSTATVQACRACTQACVQWGCPGPPPPPPPPGPATSLADDGWRVGCSFFMVVFLFFHFAPPSQECCRISSVSKKKKKVISTEMLPCPSLKMSFREFRELSKTTTSPVLNQCFIEAPSVVTLPCRGGSVCKGVPGIGLNVCSAQCKVHVVIS